MEDNGMKEYWEIKAQGVVGGLVGLTRSDFLAFGHLADIVNIKPDYLPCYATITGKPYSDFWSTLALAERLWPNITREQWLEKEKSWLNQAQAASGNRVMTGKNELDEVVSVKILLHLIAATRLINVLDDEVFTVRGGPIADATLTVVNNYISDVCLGGQTRIQKIYGRTVFDLLALNGLRPQSDSYLPNPKVALAELFLMINKDKINPEAYQ